MAQRRPGRRVGQRDPGRGRDLDAQAFLPELQRDQPALAGRGHRPGGAPRVRPAGVPDRGRARPARRDHDVLQQGQRRLHRRQPRPAPGRAQGRLGLSRLGDVRLGRDPQLGVRAQGPGPGVRRPDRRPVLGRRGVHRAAQAGLRGRQVPQGAPVGDGAPHPALDVRRRHRRVGRRTRGRPGGPQRDLPGHRPAGHRAAEERRRPAARRGQAAEDRGDRRPRSARRAERHRLGRGAPGGRLRGRHQDRRRGHHGRVS